MEKINLFGMNFISMNNYDDLVFELESGYHVGSNELPILITPNLDQTVKYHQKEHTSLFSKIKLAKYILPDGLPLVWVSKFKTNKLKARLSGRDLFAPLWRHIIASSKSVALILSKKEIGDKLTQEYKKTTYFVPPFYSIYHAQQYCLVVEAAMSMIRSKSPDYLIIGLEFPKQEYLALSLMRELEKEGLDLPLIFLLGTSMEFYTGTKREHLKFISA